MLAYDFAELAFDVTLLPHNHHAAVGAVNMQSTAIHCEV